MSTFNKPISKNKERRLNLKSKNEEQPVKPLISTEPTLSKEQIMEKASKMWNEYKSYVEKNKDFIYKSDKEKYEFFRSNMGYSIFIDEFPIVSKYMICLGQFHINAFSKLLTKIYNVAAKPVDPSDKNYNEDQWCQRQADYAAYLYEETYKKKHWNTAERKYIWETTYKLMKGEFNDFRNTHEEIKKKVEKEKVVLNAKNSRELIERVLSGTQKLSEEDQLYLISELKNLMYKKQFDDCLKDLLVSTNKIKEDLILYTTSQRGEGPDKPIPKITMIETVDANRMGEIDDKYKDDIYKGLRPATEEEIASGKDLIYL